MAEVAGAAMPSNKSRHFLAHRLGLAQDERRVGKTLLAVLGTQHLVDRTRQRFVPDGEKTAVVKHVQHGLQDVEFFGHPRQLANLVQTASSWGKAHVNLAWVPCTGGPYLLDLPPQN